MWVTRQLYLSITKWLTTAESWAYARALEGMRASNCKSEDRTIEMNHTFHNEL